MRYGYDLNNNLTRITDREDGETTYVYGVDRLSLDRFDGSTGYYLYDPRGSVTGITNEEGQIYQSYRYNANGEITFGAPQYENEYTYNGESYNPNIESQYLRARYYDVTTAAFITEDSYLGDITEPLTLNRYNYCVSSPLNYVDPSGHFPDFILDIISLIIDIGQFCEDPSLENAGWIALDAVALVIPVVTTYPAKAVKGAGDLIEVVDDAGNVVEVYELVDGATDIYRAVSNADKLKDAIDATKLMPEVLDTAKDVAELVDDLHNLQNAVEFVQDINQMRLMGQGAVAVLKSATQAAEMAETSANCLVNEVVNGGNVDTLSTPNSKVLRQNLINAGVEVPNYPNAAHHIVAGSASNAAEARAILLKYGIGINDAANGVFLPTIRDATDTSYHPSLHTNAYYVEVNNLLRDATSRQEVIDVLNYIAESLQDGTFMR